MRVALKISAFVAFAALWALLDWAGASVLTRCLVIWILLGALWIAVEIAARTSPRDAAARWIGRALPAQKPRFLAARRVFAFFLGAIFLVAFWSWGSQVRGLVGEHGLIPIGEQLASARSAGISFWQMPSLSWLAEGDAMLVAQCWLGVLLAIALCSGFFPGPCALLCWALYLSLMSVVESFGNFQWDALLLETALLAALWLPWRARPDWGTETLAQKIGRWLLWWLFVRMIIESGVVKLTWADETWLGWSALDFHFETQPLPLWTAWYAHQAPRWLLRAGCWFTYFVEIATPVLLLAPARWRFLRHGAVALQVLLQIAILNSGNYTFFNALTIALCVPFLDDTFRGFRKWRADKRQRLREPLPRGFGEFLTTDNTDNTDDADGFPTAASSSVPIRAIRGQNSASSASRGEGSGNATRDSKTSPRRWWPLVPAGALALASVCFTFEGFAGAFAGIAGQDAEMRRMREEYERTKKYPSAQWPTPMRSFNSYGLFRTMTLTRPEIILEGSADGVNWREYQFPYKPGDVWRRPSLVAPFQPRLYWQMWFAALAPQRFGYLLERLMRRVLEGEPTVLALLEKNPFAPGHPQFVRLAFYDYRFTRFEDHTTAWWKRELRGTTPAVSLEHFRKR